MHIAPGTRIGPYEVVSLLGAGGMGDVYRARDSRLDRFVALKVLSPRLAATPDVRERFQREARAVAALNHPHICTIYDVGAGEAGSLPYIAMELIEGETLHRRLQRGPAATADVVRIGLALADALDAAHARGIIHRDIKPANIAVTARGPKLLDFGLAKAAGRGVAASFEATRAGDAPLTDPGATVGTLAYMSPEQLRGDEIDARSDLFSLGLVLYELATGRPAFRGATPTMVSDAILHETPAAPRALRADLPVPLDAILLELIEKDRTIRCQSAAELRARLERFARTADLPAPASAAAPPAADPGPAAPTPVPASSTSPASSDAALAVSLVRRHRGLVLAAAVLLAALAAAAFALLPRPGGGSTRSAAAPPAGPTSIAVLPFTDVSPDGDQEYFADGISDELSTVLSRIPDLQVTGRTSSFHFKGRNEDLRTIGEQLGVGYLLTGSVRKAGARVRITPALVNAATGYQLWSTSYDRPLDDIFEVQEEIAAAVADALQVTLGVGFGGRPGMTRDVGAFEEAARALSLLLQYQPETFPAAAEHAQRALALDPSFAEASLLLEDLYRQMAVYAPDRAAEWTRRAVEVIAQANARTPGLPTLQFSAAVEERRRGNWLEAGAIVETQSSALPKFWTGSFLLAAGRARAAIEVLESARAEDPLSARVTVNLAEAYASAGQFGAAFAEWDRGLQLGQLGLILQGSALVGALGAGDQQEIERRLQDLATETSDIGLRLNSPLARLRDTPAIASAEIRRLAAGPDYQNYVGRTILAFWAAHHGDADLAFEFLDQIYDTGIDASLPWRPVFREVRTLPAFKDLLRRSGYVDYWRTYGWADFCRPTAGDDFECE